MQRWLGVHEQALNIPETRETRFRPPPSFDDDYDDDSRCEEAREIYASKCLQNICTRREGRSGGAGVAFDSSEQSERSCLDVAARRVDDDTARRRSSVTFGLPRFPPPGTSEGYTRTFLRRSMRARECVIQCTAVRSPVVLNGRSNRIQPRRPIDFPYSRPFSASFSKTTGARARVGACSDRQEAILRIDGRADQEGWNATIFFRAGAH